MVCTCDNLLSVFEPGVPNFALGSVDGHTIREFVVGVVIVGDVVEGACADRDLAWAGAHQQASGR
ncbi:Uncharacterised protein [Mycobacteroides abscessus subsp. abscessus]|nr:Uncharacterised protein [Mycobacteroides abscessus subsp. abscessus]